MIALSAIIELTTLRRAKAKGRQSAAEIRGAVRAREAGRKP
jgi:hypothetical protein